MKRILFDEEDRDFAAPGFCLMDQGGRQIGPEDFGGQKNLFLVMPGRNTRLNPGDFLSRTEAYRQQNAMVLWIDRQPNPVPQAEADILRVLTDPAGVARQGYLSLMVDGLVDEIEDLAVLLDRNGGIFAALAGESLSDSELQAEGLQWLRFIDAHCPECTPFRVPGD
jgi:hypothetical protein